MQKYIGKKIQGGIVEGKIFILNKNQDLIYRYHVEEIESEIQRFEAAKIKALEQLRKLYDIAMIEVGEENASIFEVHGMMLEDEDYSDAVHNRIRTQKINAEYAVAATGDDFFEMFDKMEDPYFKARSIDIKDISKHLVSVLTGKESVENKWDERNVHLCTRAGR